ncbi:MAG: hypothetical protein JHC30_06130 [Caldisericum sp.]|nr:hypothetical protein [Caldisericum sp.]
MRTGYFVENNFFGFIHAPKELEKKLRDEGFEVYQSFQLLSGDYKIVVRLPKLGKKNAINRLIQIVKEVNDENRL